MQMGGLLGLTQPQFMSQYTPQGLIGGNLFGGGMGRPNPMGGNLQQGFAGRAFGRGFGSLFGDSAGKVNFGGGNFFQSGRGFWNASPTPAFAGGKGVNPGMDFGSFFGSLFG